MISCTAARTWMRFIADSCWPELGTHIPDVLVSTHVYLFKLAVQGLAQVLTHFHGYVFRQHGQQQSFLKIKKKKNKS